MKILVINGSPNGKNSNTLKLADSFVNGFNRSAEHSVERIDLSQLTIGSCHGCFSCWEKTPGKCVIGDDMADVLEKYIHADLVIWSFPLYYFSVPGLLKTIIDRLLPLNLPFMTENTDGIGSGGHPPRYDLGGQKHAVISTCGFYSAEGNYDGVISLFDHMLGKGNYACIVCGQGELFSVPELHARTNGYLKTVESAGAEYAHGAIADTTFQALHELLFPKREFEEMADANWAIHDGPANAGEETDFSLNFTRQMAALYHAADDKERVLEMHYTDVDKTYQIRLSGEGHAVLTENFLPYTTRIETPFSLWRDIAQGKITGAEALSQGKYRVLGDFSLMIHWDEYFGVKKNAGRNDSAKAKGYAFWVCLAPWVAFWSIINSLPHWGAYVVIVLAADIPLFSYRHALTIYDSISAFSITALSVCSLFLPLRVVLAASYGIFALLWLVSALFAKVPLSAWYVSDKYGGNAAFSNPLFIRTNRIIDIGWGIVYALCCLLMAINIYLPAVLLSVLGAAAMGVFTAWFQKWYPAHCASRAKLS